MANIANLKVAVLATDGVEQVELTEPVKALKAASAEVVVIAPKGGQIQGMNHDQKMRFCCRAEWPTRTRFGPTRRRWPS